jgi:hypothetical protein
MSGIHAIMLGGQTTGVVDLPDGPLAGLVFGYNSDPATCSFTISNAGTYTLDNDAGVISGNWIDPQSGMAGFSVRATLVSGVTPSGTLNTWLQITEPRVWSVTRNTVGSSSGTITIDIAVAGSTTPIDSVNVQLGASVTSSPP